MFFIKTMKTSTCKLALTLGLLTIAVLPVSAEKIFDFSFDGNGLKEASGRGAIDALELTLLATDGKPKDVRSAPGTGVSGKPGDRAFDGTSATGMGKATAEGVTNRGPVAVADKATPALSSLSSYTISGWMRTNQPVESAARILVCTVVGKYNSILELRATPNAGGLTVDLSETPDTKEPKRKNSDLVYNYPDQWVFFAVTFTAMGETKTNVLEFYIGTLTEPTKLAGKRLFNGISGADTGVLAIGNLKNGQRPFQGLLDNIRIHGSTKDASGALTLAQLEELRNNDISGGAKNP